MEIVDDFDHGQGFRVKRNTADRRNLVAIDASDAFLVCQMPRIPPVPSATGERIGADAETL